MSQAKVYIQGRPFNGITAQTFQSQRKYQIVNDLSDSDIVVWTGGEDISPELYGEKPIPGTYFSPDRDLSDLKAVDEAVKQGKFLCGICRGAQLLNVIPNGGKLWQNVDNHGSRVHRAFDCISGQYIRVNSVHHQAMRVTDEAEIICWAIESVHKEAQKDEWHRPDDVTTIPESEKDLEVVWYPKTKSFLFQGHPEFGHPPTTEYFFSLMEKFYWRK